MKRSSRKPYCPLWLTALLLALLGGACSRTEVTEPQPPALPELQDAIPYEALGSGTIAFERIGPYPGEYQGLYVIDVKQRKTRAFDLGLATDFCISPDGKKVALSKYYGRGGDYDIYTLSIEDGSLTHIDYVTGQDRAPSWDPEGRYIYFWVSGPPALYRQPPRPASPDLRVIRNLAGHEPSGRFAVATSGYIAYVANFCWSGYGAPGLYLLDSDGNERLLVPRPEDRFFESPVFSADERQIYFLSVQTDSALSYRGMDLMKVNLDGSALQSLLHMNASGSQEWAQNSQTTPFTLSRSPDGQKLLFNLVEGDFTSHLYLVHTDGSGLTQVTSAEGVTDREVSWGGE